MWCRRKSLDSTTPLLLFESSLVSLLVWARIVPITHGRDVVCRTDVPASIHRLRELLVRRSFVRSDEMFPNKRLPLFLGDRAQRIMSAGAVKRPILVEHHLLNQVFATAEKDVANAAVILNDAAQPSLNVIAPVLQQLLKLVHDDCDAVLVLRRDFGGCFQNFLQHRFNPSVFCQAE